MARKKWLRVPGGDFYGYKYRVNERCSCLIEEIVWDEDVVPLPIKRLLKKFSSKEKQRIWDKTGGKCHYCGIPLKPWGNFSVDHVVPRSKGGTGELDNLVPSCIHCNHVKKDRPVGVMYE